MASAVTLTVRGDKAVMKRLKSLHRTVAKKVITKAARTAMKPVMKAARDNAPKKTGAMRKAIKLYSLKKNRRGEIGIMVALGDKKKWYTGDQFYGAFQEFGWKVGRRLTRRSIRPDTRKQVEGKHFIERAYQSHGEQAMRTFMDEVPREIEKAMATGGK